MGNYTLVIHSWVLLFSLGVGLISYGVSGSVRLASGVSGAGIVVFAAVIIWFANKMARFFKESDAKSED